MKLKSPILMSLLMLVVCILFLPSCVTTTAPDGAVTERVDQEAVNPWLLLARELFAPKEESAPVPIIVLPEK